MKRQETPEPDSRHGHRERLRDRFANSGPDALADYELLELLLFRSLPRRDTKPIAKALLKHFGSFSALFGASLDRLKEVEGVGDTVALDLKTVFATMQRMQRADILGRNVLDSWNAVVAYCQSVMAEESREQFRVLFLDKKNALIADEVQQSGTVDQTPVYPREVVRRALELSSTALILVHNHPSGDPTPSRADIEMTHKVVEACTPLSIQVHDHIIIGRGTHVSFRALDLI